MVWKKLYVPEGKLGSYKIPCMSTQVAGIALIYEVHRNARSEARKEERRKQELEVSASFYFVSEAT